MSQGRKIIEGTAHKVGDHINTDLIIPATFLVSSDPRELGRHLFEGSDPGFVSRIERGDLIVAGENFGSGSSREHAALALKGAGISCVVASSFARIFFRNAINVGLPIVESPEASEAVEDGDRLRVDLEAGLVYDLTSGQSFEVESYPGFMRGIIDAGGLIEYIRRRGPIQEADPASDDVTGGERRPEGPCTG